MRLAIPLGVLLLFGCGESDGTRAEPLVYPGDFPVSQVVPDGSAALYFEVAGLQGGDTYTATLVGPVDPAPGADFDLGVYRIFEPTPPNSLCNSFADGDDSCDFEAPGAVVYVEVLNLASLSDEFTLDITRP